ncbi:hypothetical protein YV74_000201 [Salmonella enterica subsp. enterica serovar Weltevreden]|nr:hypothetical protein [Salmonella enterica subsp. enterica serovar Weltevreden]EGI6035285.1 hypothetical protein [Salmonella enterica subsp. enterica serovar Weltevreden]
MKKMKHISGIPGRTPCTDTALKKPMRVELTGTHTHLGEVLAAGAIVEVNEITGQWLLKNGPAKPAGKSEPEHQVQTVIFNNETTSKEKNA